MDILNILLTGGPAAGKTTAMKVIKDECQQAGRKVFVAPEVATMLYRDMLPERHTLFGSHEQELQSIILGYTLLHHTSLNKLARLEGGQCVIVHDRGTPDIQAYLPDMKTYESVLVEHGLDVESAFALYDEVIFLNSVSALRCGTGEGKYSGKETNVARREDATAAAEKNAGQLAFLESHYGKFHNIAPTARPEDKMAAIREVVRTILA